VDPGGTASFVVELPAGITPPPGVQQDRALWQWHVQLRAKGVGWDAPAEVSFPLRVSNVRPRASHGRDYQAEVRIPLWVAPSVRSR
jgi:hypothetical protein